MTAQENWMMIVPRYYAWQERRAEELETARYKKNPDEYRSRSGLFVVWLYFLVIFHSINFGKINLKFMQKKLKI